MRRILLGPLLALLAACQPDKPVSQTPVTVPVYDDLGRLLTLPAHPRRVIGLAPSMTEMLFAVADTTTIVARTPNDNYPAAARRKPVVNNYPLDIEKLVALKPDVIFTVEGMTSPDDAQRLQQLGIPVYYQRYRKVEDVLSGMDKLGALVSQPVRAKRLTDSLRQELKVLAASAKRQAPTPPKILAITWQDPIYCYGQNTLFTDQIRLAGGQNAVTETFAQPFPALTREYILKLNPDVLLGGSFEKLDSTFFKNYPELRRINAYKTHHVYAITGDLMERPGPRVVESVRELQQLVEKSISRLPVSTVR